MRSILCKWAACFLWVLWALTGSAAAVSPDDPDVMSRVVRSEMKQILLAGSVDTGTLLLSDCPEYVTAPGILYGDKVSGPCRMYFYHVNEMPFPGKIVVIAYNPGDEPVDVALTGFQYARPSALYYLVGKELSTMYYEGDRTVNTVQVGAHDYALLADRLDKIAVWPEQLFSGIVDMELPSPVYVSAVMVPLYEDSLTFVKKQQYLPSDAFKMRGTFPGKDRYIKSLFSYAPNDGISCIKIGDGIYDPFLKGRDVMDNRISENVGNYGLDYTITVKTKGEGSVHLYFNTLGGEYAGVAELFYKKDTPAETTKIVELPSAGLSMGRNDSYGIQYVDTFSAGTDVTIHMMPPGAANLPVRFIFVPDGDLQALAEKGTAAEADKKEKT